MRRRIFWGANGLLFVYAILGASGAQARAAIITSSNFSLGFGANVNGFPNGAWTTTETNSANTPVTGGNANNTVISLGGGFSLTPAVVGGYQTSNGPTFVNRVFATGPTATNYVGGSTTFAPSFTGAYGGTLPVNAANIQTTLHITNLSLRVSAFNISGFSTPLTFHFHETTSGHAATSSATTVNQITTNSAAARIATNYTLATWDPADFAISGLSSLRSFNVDGFGASGSGGVLYFLEGFEISGHIEVSYLLVPEPASAVLVFGAAVLAFVALRKARVAQRQG